MTPTHASFLNGIWGWEYGVILCPVKCVRGDGIVPCHGQAHQTQLR